VVNSFNPHSTYHLLPSIFFASACLPAGRGISEQPEALLQKIRGCIDVLRIVSQKVLICHPELVSGSRNTLILLGAEPMLNRVQHKVQKHDIFFLF
jgi:hypothetical protein